MKKPAQAQYHVTVYDPMPLHLRVETSGVYPLLIIELGTGLNMLTLHLMGDTDADIAAYVTTMRDFANEWLQQHRQTQCKAASAEAQPVPVVMGSAAGSPDPDVREGVLRDEALREGWPEALAR